MNRVLHNSFVGVLALGLVGCGVGPRVAADDDGGGEVLTARDVAILNVSDSIDHDNSGFTLGAGDALGQHVFTHAVALARAQNGDLGWRYADASRTNGGIGVGIGNAGGGSDRAIYPGFLGMDSPLNTEDAFETVWIFTSRLRSRDRATSLTDPNGGVRGGPAPAVIVLVPEE